MLGEWLYEKAPEQNKLKYIDDYAAFWNDATLDGFFKRYSDRVDVDKFIEVNRDELDMIAEEQFKETMLNEPKSTFEHNNAYYEFKRKYKTTKIVKSFLRDFTTEDRDLLDSYYESHLQQFLKDHGLLNHLENLSQTDKWFKIFKGKVFVGDRTSFIQNRRGQYYIPGSSIKGCIKTAILYELLKREKDSNKQDFYQKYEQIIDDNIDNNVKLDSFSEKVLKKFYMPEPPDWKKHKPGNFALDFTRCIHITDAEIKFSSVSHKEEESFFDAASDVWEIKSLFNNLQAVKGERIVTIHAKDAEVFDLREGDQLSFLEIEQRGRHDRIKDCKKIQGKEPEDTEKPQAKKKKNSKDWETIGWMTLHQNGNKLELDKKGIRPQKIECITGHAKFRISLNRELLDQLWPDETTRPFSDIDGLLTLVENFAEKIWQEEQDFFDKDISTAENRYDISKIVDFYKDESNKPSMRIGWGTGLLGMTILSLFDKSIGVRQKVRNTANPRNARGNQVAPKSRRFVLDKGKPYRPLGWCRLSWGQNKQEVDESSNPE